MRSDFEDEIKKNGISCLFFDDRRDDTKVMLEWDDNIDKQFPD